MSFTLRLEFTGLNLFVQTKDDRCIVLMPDCRLGSGIVAHADGDQAEPHAGYFRLDAAALGLPLPAAGLDGPPYELVHRLAGEEATFSGLSGVPVRRLATDPFVPTFDAPFFDSLQLRPDQLASTPTGLLFRLVLTGGEFQPMRGTKNWEVDDALNASRASQSGQFTNKVAWHTTIDDANLKLSVRDFAGTYQHEFDLSPVPLEELDGQLAIVVKFVNVCQHNTMAWSELPPQLTANDVDFKWLYQLLESATRQSIAQRVIVAGRELPHPVRVGTGGLSDQGCMGARIRG